MTPAEAADIVDAIAESMQAEPHQFEISVSVIGQSVANTGGIGILAAPQGGGPGSTTIGNMVSMDGATIQIAQRRAHAAMDEQTSALVAELRGMAAELRSPAPRSPKLKAALARLTGTWVPGIITSILGALLARALGV